MNMRPHAQAFLNGEINAIQSLELQYRDDLARNRSELAICRARNLPVSAAHHRREAVRLYLNIRRLRRVIQ